MNDPGWYRVVYNQKDRCYTPEEVQDILMDEGLIVGTYKKEGLIVGYKKPGWYVRFMLRQNEFQDVLFYTKIANKWRIILR